MELIENMAANDHVFLCDQVYMPTKKYLLELTSQDAMLAQNKLLTKTLETLTATLSNLPQQLHAVQPPLAMHIGRCNICGGTHESGSCMVQDDTSNEVNYMGNQNHQGFHQGGPPGFSQRGIFCRARIGDPIQGIISTKEVHIISLLAKSPTNRRKPLS